MRADHGFVVLILIAACAGSPPREDEAARIGRVFNLTPEEVRVCGGEAQVVESRRRKLDSAGADDWQRRLTYCLENEAHPEIGAAKRRAEEERLAEQQRDREERARVEERRAADERARAEAEEEVRESQLEENRAHLAAYLKTRKAMRIAWSSVQCVLRRVRTEAKGSIAEEQRYAREGGGIVDMRKLYSRQQALRVADRGIALAAKELSSAHVLALQCDHADVRGIVACFPSNEGQGCDRDAADLHAAITRDKLNEMIESLR